MGTSTPGSTTGTVQPRMRGRRPGTFLVRRDYGGGDPLYDERLAALGWYRSNGEPVVRARYALRITQGQLAQAVGTEQVYISYVERSQGFMGLREADHLAETLARLAAERGIALDVPSGRDLLDPTHRPPGGETPAGLPAPARRPA